MFAHSSLQDFHLSPRAGCRRVVRTSLTCNLSSRLVTVDLQFLAESEGSARRVWRDFWEVVTPPRSPRTQQRRASPISDCGHTSPPCPSATWRAASGGASVPASRLVSSLAPPGFSSGSQSRHARAREDDRARWRGRASGGDRARAWCKNGSGRGRRGAGGTGKSQEGRGESGIGEEAAAGLHSAILSAASGPRTPAAAESNDVP